MRQSLRHLMSNRKRRSNISHFENIAAIHFLVHLLLNYLHLTAIELSARLQKYREKYRITLISGE